MKNEQMIKKLMEAANITQHDQDLLFKENIIPSSANLSLEDLCIIEKLEAEYEFKVFYATKTGNMFLNLFICSKYEEDNLLTLEDLPEGIAFGYVYNYQIPHFSEFGSFGYVNERGLLFRIS